MYSKIIEPLEDRVLVLPIEALSVTAGGIIIPDTAQERPVMGRIILAGKGRDEMPMVVQEGDKVLYGKYTGHEVKHNGKEHLIMRQSDIISIVAE